MSAAWLLHGRPGYGKWNVLRAVAARLLCEQPQAAGEQGALPPGLPPEWAHQRACGHCASCALVQAGTHPDLFIAVPEATSVALGVAPVEGADKAERKSTSQDIRIDQIRDLSDWAVRTSHRGGSKVALIYPADALNAAASNALLKTLEEPPEAVQFLLGAHRLDAVWPTVRSRCRLAAMPRPGAEVVQGAAPGKAAVPDDVLAWTQHAVYGADLSAGLDWIRQTLDAVKSVQAGQHPTGWPPPPDYATALAALLKLGADVQRVQAGGAPQFLPSEAKAVQRLASRFDALRLAEFLRKIVARLRRADFPLNQPLAIDALLLEFGQLFA